MQTVTLLASALMSLALVIGCADSAEQRLSQVQNELERVLRTALRDGDIRMQRTNDHLTVVIAERLLFDAGSGRLLGAHMVGQSASELIHIGQAYLRTGATAEQMADAVVQAAVHAGEPAPAYLVTSAGLTALD